MQGAFGTTDVGISELLFWSSVSPGMQTRDVFSSYTAHASLFTLTEKHEKLPGMPFGMLFLIHLLSTAYMTGLIWFVQIVHYPLFASVAPESFSDYEVKHQFRTTFVVLPPMLAEIGTGIALYFQRESFASNQLVTRYFLFSLVLLLIIWLSTFLIQVPLHAKLEKVFDLSTVQRLVDSNWIRTICWSLRSIVLIYLLYLLKFQAK